MLEVKNVSKSFGEQRILENINFELKSGESLVLVGNLAVVKLLFQKLLLVLNKLMRGVLFFMGKN